MALQVNFIGAQKYFSTLQVSLRCKGKTRTSGAQTIAFAAVPLRRQGARKIIKSRGMKPTFKTCWWR